MKNPWDPFGVFGEWRGQDLSEAVDPLDKVTDKVVDDCWQELTGSIRHAVEAGTVHEREAILKLINRHLDPSDPRTERLITDIHRRNPIE